MAIPTYLECNLCGNRQLYEPFVPAICTRCESPSLEARYDYDAFKREILRGLPNRPSNMWRYQDVLPLSNPPSLDLYPAGGTPLWLSQRFAPNFGHTSVYIKDERYGPTSSFVFAQSQSVGWWIPIGLVIIAFAGSMSRAFHRLVSRFRRAKGEPTFQMVAAADG